MKLVGKEIEISNYAPYIPEQNGTAERANLTIVKTARTMLQTKYLLIFLWAEAVNTAIYLQSRNISRVNPEKTPFEMWQGVNPNMQHLKIFGGAATENAVLSRSTRLLSGHPNKKRNYSRDGVLSGSVRNLVGN